MAITQRLIATTMFAGVRDRDNAFRRNADLELDRQLLRRRAGSITVLADGISAACLLGERNVGGQSEA